MGVKYGNVSEKINGIEKIGSISKITIASKISIPLEISGTIYVYFNGITVFKIIYK